MSSLDIMLSAAGASSDSYWISTITLPTVSGQQASFPCNIVVAPSGNIYATFTAINSTAQVQDVIVVKYNPSGIIQWQKKYASSGADRTRSIAIDNSENVYVTFWGAAAGLIKLNSSGTLLWVRRVTTSSLPLFSYVGVDASQQPHLFGYYFDGSYYTCFRIIYDTAGNVISNTTFRGGNGSSSTTLQGAKLLNSEPYWVGDVRGSACIGKYTSSNKSYNVLPANHPEAFTVGVTAQGVSPAAVYGAFNNNGVTVIAKYDTSLTQIWRVPIGSTYTNSILIYGIACDDSGNVYIAGYNNNDTTESFIAKLNSSGTVQWQRSIFVSGQINRIYSIAVIGNSVYIIGGLTSPPKTYIIKYPTNGSITGTYGVYNISSSSYSFGSVSAYQNITDTGVVSSVSTATDGLTEADISYSYSNTVM